MRLNPSSAIQWISQIQLAVTPRATPCKKESGVWFKKELKYRFTGFLPTSDPVSGVAVVADAGEHLLGLVELAGGVGVAGLPVSAVHQL